MEVPPFIEHVFKGAVVGSFVGSGVAAVGWIIRSRNAIVVDLGIPTPVLLKRHRGLSETLLQYKQVSEVSPDAKALFNQLVVECEFVAANENAQGGMQVRVQKRVSQAIYCADKLCKEAFRLRHPQCYECRMNIETLKGQLGAIQKNMMTNNM